MIRTVNPATGKAIAEYAPFDAGEIERRLERAARAFAAWSARPPNDRAAALEAVAERLERDRDRWARLMTVEMGKPIAASEAEVDKCAWVCRHYAEHGERYLHPREIATDASRSVVRHDPLGPILAVMPWNFPFWQVFRFAAPALMAGNVGLLKHASNVTGCALGIESVFAEAGLPEGAFQTLVMSASEVGAVIEDARIRAVTLTGSEPAGRAVAARAGDHVKKSLLELGGSDPFVVLEDADLDRAADTGVAARMLNTGQSCIAAKRFVVVDAVHDAFVERFVRRVESLRVGDPLDRTNDLGPLARGDLVDDLDRQVRSSVRDGARVRAGGNRVEGPGFFYAPTVLTEVREDHPVAAEETFGPVAPFLRVADEAEAVAVANRTVFGLGASLWTADASRGERLASRIEAGSVFVNGLVKSDPRLPFGGVKRSGYGRELGAEGIREFVNVKTVWIA